MSSFSHPDEDEWLVRVAEGDELAFRRLFYQYHQQLGTYLLKITGSVELAEEITQDVFLKIWMTRESLVEIKSFKAYLFVVSKNYALNCLRTLSKERTQKKEWESSIRSMSVDTEEPVQIHYSNLIDEAIQQLPPQQLKVYLLSRHKRLKHREIAEQLILSKETIKKYIQLSAESITNYIRTHQKEQ